MSPLGRISFPGTEDCCSVCRLAVTELLTNAHLHGSHRTVRLCWTCHRAYDIDVLTTKEVLAAESATRAQRHPVNVNTIHREWERDLVSGKRRINKQRQHGRTFEQSSANAQKAWDTMRRKRDNKIGSAQQRIFGDPQD